MATNTISQLASSVNENSSISIDFLNNHIPVVSSLHISQHFNKKHKHVLRAIQDLCSNLPKSFCESNFGPTYIPVKQPNGGFREIPAFYLTRDAFSLLVMGFTGPQAMKWKLKYIEAFNTLEATVLENSNELARQSGYQQGIDEARALPSAEAERKTAYLEGMQEGYKLQKRKDGLVLARKAADYRKKGLNLRETAHLLDIPKRTLEDLLARARKLGAVL